jgi:5-methylcytosine-specific restriction endonuclease McrA
MKTWIYYCQVCGKDKLAFAPRKTAYICKTCIRIVHQKKPIPESIKWKVWERDNFTCKKCGSRQFLSVDHIFPEVKGGTLDMDNLQTLCKSCNSAKGAR